MENPYVKYYQNQSGSGIQVYSGHRYHTGRGFFGKILKHIYPALKYIGRQGIDAFQNMSKEVLSGENIANAGVNSLVNTAQNVLKDATSGINKFKRTKQSGGGREKRKVKRIKRRKTKKRSIKQKKTHKNLYKRRKRKAKVQSFL